MAGGWLSSAPQVLGLPLAPGFRVGVDFLKEIFYLNHSLGAVTSEREEALGSFAIITLAQALSIVMVRRRVLSRRVFTGYFVRRSLEVNSA